ncbi:hypothetical protein [Hoylesella saccharolytica]
MDFYGETASHTVAGTKVPEFTGTLLPIQPCRS